MRKLLATVAALACGTTLAVTGGGPAQASTGGCPTNSFCLYSETQTQSSATLIFFANGTTMFNNPDKYFVNDLVKQFSSVYVANRTGGYMCTYDASLNRLGRFAPGAVMPIAAGSPYGRNWQVRAAKYCQSG